MSDHQLAITPSNKRVLTSVTPEAHAEHVGLAAPKKRRLRRAPIWHFQPTPLKLSPWANAKDTSDQSPGLGKRIHDADPPRPNILATPKADGRGTKLSSPRIAAAKRTLRELASSPRVSSAAPHRPLQRTEKLKQEAIRASNSKKIRHLDS